MRDSETFSSHASRCRKEAADATLDNVRDRALRAEAAWMVMAERSLKTEASRDARDARVVEPVAAE